MKHKKAVAGLGLPPAQKPRIRAACAYSVTAGSARRTLRYNGERLDFAQSGGELPLAALRDMTTSREYVREDKAELQNSVRLSIRGKGKLGRMGTGSWGM